MKIIKEYCPHSNRCILRTDTYCHNLQHIMSLYLIAFRDFSFITMEKVEIVQYGGTRIKRTWGIEFNIPPIEFNIPKDYIEIEELE